MKKNVPYGSQSKYNGPEMNVKMLCCQKSKYFRMAEMENFTSGKHVWVQNHEGTYSPC